MSFNFNEYFTELHTGEVLLSCKGSITSDVISNILADVEKYFDNNNPEETKARKKIYNVLVESLQNLFHHNIDLPEEFHVDKKFIVVVITKNEGEYRIINGNYITASKIKFLSEKIDKINSLTQEELKEMYKFILNHQKLSAKGGGGLGLIDIARKTGKKMEYKFHQVSEEYYFYSLNIFISNS
jgi:hypothetical protein